MYLGNRSYNKYKNHRTKEWHSDRERNRYQELLLRQRVGQISELNRQVRFELIPNQYKDGKCIFRKVTYIADFTYIEDGNFIVEDSKGFKTDEYKIKKKLMHQVHGILIKET